LRTRKPLRLFEPITILSRPQIEQLLKLRSKDAEPASAVMTC